MFCSFATGGRGCRNVIKHGTSITSLHCSRPMAFMQLSRQGLAHFFILDTVQVHYIKNASFRSQRLRWYTMRWRGYCTVRILIGAVHIGGSRVVYAWCPPRVAFFKVVVLCVVEIFKMAVLQAFMGAVGQEPRAFMQVGRQRTDDVAVPPAGRAVCGLLARCPPHVKDSDL